MKLTAQQLRAIRRRREGVDNEAQDRAMQRFGELFGLDDGTVAFSPPSVIVGWYDALTAMHFCLRCADAQWITSLFRLVYRESVHAKASCITCGRTLEDVHAAGG